MATVGRKITNVPRERLAFFDGIPQEPEDARGHIGVADDVVRGALELACLVSRKPHEHVVGLVDVAAFVGRREEQLTRLELEFVACGVGALHGDLPLVCVVGSRGAGGSDAGSPL